MYGEQNAKIVLGIIMDNYAKGLSESELKAAVESETSSFQTIGPGAIALIVAIIFS